MPSGPPAILDAMPATETAPAGAATGREFVRLEPPVAAAAQLTGALLVDIRPRASRCVDGEIPGSLVVAGPVRGWHIEPGDPMRVTDVGPALPVVVIGDGGHASILAASALRGYGVNATDVIGGFTAWASYGLPICRGGTPAGHYVDDDEPSLPALAG